MAEAWLPLRIIGCMAGSAIRSSGIAIGSGAVETRSPNSFSGSSSS